MGSGIGREEPHSGAVPGRPRFVRTLGRAVLFLAFSAFLMALTGTAHAASRDTASSQTVSNQPSKVVGSAAARVRAHDAATDAREGRVAPRSTSSPPPHASPVAAQERPSTPVRAHGPVRLRSADGDHDIGARAHGQVAAPDRDERQGGRLTVSVPPEPAHSAGRQLHLASLPALALDLPSPPLWPGLDSTAFSRTTGSGGGLHFGGLVGAVLLGASAVRRPPARPPGRQPGDGAVTRADGPGSRPG